MKSLLILLLLGASAGAASVERTFTLEDSERLALLNDPRVLSAEQDKIIAQEREREARYLFLPEFGLAASATKYEARYPFSLSHDNILLFPDAPNPYGPTTGNLYSGRGYMNLSLYEGGRTFNTLRLAQAGRKQASSALESVKLDLAYSVKEVFYRLILAQERMAAVKQYQAAVEDLASGARLEGWDRVEAEARAAEARARDSEAEHALNLARLAFLKSVNIELDTTFTVSGSLQTRAVPIDIDKAILWAIELRPELQSETYKAQMDAIGVNLAAARRRPTVFLAGDYEITNETFPLRRNNWDATIGMRIPFSYDYWSLIKQKRAEQRQGQLKRAELQDRVRLEVRQSYETLQYWQKEWPAREAQYKRLQQLFETTARQAGSPAARIRALGGVLDLKLSYLSSVTEHILALARLERAVGREITP